MRQHPTTSNNTRQPKIKHVMLRRHGDISETLIMETFRKRSASNAAHRTAERETTLADNGTQHKRPCTLASDKNCPP